jgi:hypothetical protein
MGSCSLHEVGHQVFHTGIAKGHADNVKGLWRRMAGLTLWFLTLSAFRARNMV